MKHPVSLVIAAKNCEDRIEGTIRPWAGLVEEIIVVDEESSDLTAERARNLGAKVIRQKAPDGNFDRNRKTGMEASTQPWILYLDTDERPNAELLLEFENFFKDPQKLHEVSGVRIPNDFYFLGTKLRYGIYRKSAGEIRLFKRDAYQYSCEQGLHRGVLVKERVIDFKNSYRHFNVNTLSEWFMKTNQYTEIDALAASGPAASAFKTVWLAIRFFIKHYFFRQGFRDGTAGFLAVVYFSFYHFTQNFKIWEKQQLKSKVLEQDYLNPISIPKR